MTEGHKPCVLRAFRPSLCPNLARTFESRLGRRVSFQSLSNAQDAGFGGTLKHLLHMHIEYMYMYCVE